MISFAMSGFLFGYITTRTLLTRMFVRYDWGEIHSVVDARIDVHEEEDALALRLVIQQLDEDEPPVDRRSCGPPWRRRPGGRCRCSSR
jgi:hypothetical protein